LREFSPIFSNLPIFPKFLTLHTTSPYTNPLLMKSSPLSRCLPLAFAGALAAIPASAAIETFSADYGSAASPLPLDSSQNVTLGQFNTSLGALDGITIELLSEDTVQTEILNSTAGSLPYTSASTAVPIGVTALNGLTTTVSATAGPFAGTAPPQSVTVDGSSSPISLNSSANVPSSDFGLYEGSGPQTFNVSVLVGEPFIEGSGASLAFAGLGSSYGTVEVIYNYSAVPEPRNTWAGLAALGFCGIVGARRLRRHKV
jgi:hypothetical protein